jgi:hypothetical protein
LSSLLSKQGAQGVGSDSLTRPTVTVLQTHSFLLAGKNDQIGLDGIRFDKQHGFDTFIAGFNMPDINAAIEEKYLDLLGAIGK